VRERLTNDRAVRRPGNKPRADLLVDAEWLQRSAQLAMVAPLDLLELLEVGVELLWRRPHGPIDPRELRLCLVAPPVRARDREQLEGADLSGPLDMRSPAEIDEAVVLVDAHAAAYDLVIALVVLPLVGELLEIGRASW